jgi:hypothetical protein
VVRDNAHVIAREQAVLARFTTEAPCQHKTRRPASAASVAEAARLRGTAINDPAAHVVIDLAHYAQIAQRLQHTGQHQQPSPSTSEEIL